METGEQTWLVDRLVPAESINMLVGNPGIGKSLLVLDLCCSVATGRNFLGREVRQGRVMYLAAEDGWRRVARRLRLWADGLDLDPSALADLFVLPSGLQIAAGEGIDGEAVLAAWEQLSADIATVSPVLVVLDPLVDVHEGLDENKAGEMAALMRVLRRLVRGKDRALVLTHHDRKGTLEPSVYSARGSGAIPAGSDGQYHMVAAQLAGDDEDVLAAGLHVTKGRDLPPNLKRPVGMRFVGGRWHEDAGALAGKKAKERDLLTALYDALMRAGGQLRIGEAAQATGVAYNTATAHLERLVALGAVKRTSERPATYLALPGGRDKMG